MSFESLQERLTALQETTAQLQQLIDRLATLHQLEQSDSISPLAVSPDEQEDGAELSVEINQILREQEEDLDLLQEEITDLRHGRLGSDVEHNRTRLRDGVKRLEQVLRICRMSFRKAQLTARRNLEQSRRLQRELQLATLAAAVAQQPESFPRSGPVSPTAAWHAGDGGPQPPSHQTLPARRRGQHAGQATSATGLSAKDQQVVDASASVTASLQRMHELMATELARSGYAHETLAESTAALKGLSDQYDSLDGLLAGSRELLGTLLRSQKSDTWYLQTTLWILLTTLGWLIFRRWLYGPLWWLVWLPLKLLFRVVFAVSASGSGAVSRGEGALGVGSSPVQGGGGVDAARVELTGKDAPVVNGDRHGDKPIQGSGDESSMLAKVGRVIDGDTQNSSGDQPNPKKRMWEEEVEARHEAERTKEEL